MTSKRGKDDVPRKGIETQISEEGKTMKKISEQYKAQYKAIYDQFYSGPKPPNLEDNQAPTNKVNKKSDKIKDLIASGLWFAVAIISYFSGNFVLLGLGALGGIVLLVLGLTKK